MLPDVQSRFAAMKATLKDGELITLRLLRAGDAEALAEFYESVPREDYRHYAPHPLTREQAHLKATTLAESATFICVIGENSLRQIVGYAWVSWKATDADRGGLGVLMRRGYQGIGTGQAIIRRLLEIVREAGPRVVDLTVNQANPRAVALYQKMGFKIVREQMRSKIAEFPPEPEYYMELQLR